MRYIIIFLDIITKLKARYHYQSTGRNFGLTTQKEKCINNHIPCNLAGKGRTGNNTTIRRAAVREAGVSLGIMGPK